MAGSTRWWRPVLPELERRFTVHLVDLRRVRPEEGATRLAEELAHLERPAVIGHSLGGLLSAQLAARYDVSRLVLVAPAGVPTGRPLPVDALAALSSLRDAAPRFLPVLLVDVLRWGPVGLLRAGLYATGDRLRETVSHVEAPTLIVWGERDLLLPVRLAQAWCEAIPHARLVLIPDAGHVPMYENPSAFVRVVCDFLEHEPRDLRGCGEVDGVRVAGDDDETAAR